METAFAEMLQQSCSYSRMAMLLATIFLLMALIAVNVAEGKLCYSECTDYNVIEVNSMSIYMHIQKGGLILEMLQE
jgi:hypothetical protein